MRSFLVPWLQLAVVQNLDLVLHGVEPVAAKRQQSGAALVARQHLVQRHLARLDAGHKLFQLFQRRFVAGGFGGERRFCRGLGHGEGSGGARGEKAVILGATLRRRRQTPQDPGGTALFTGTGAAHFNTRKWDAGITPPPIIPFLSSNRLWVLCSAGFVFLSPVRTRTSLWGVFRSGHPCLI